MVNLDKRQYFTPWAFGLNASVDAMLDVDTSTGAGVPPALILLLASFREVRGGGDPNVRD